MTASSFSNEQNSTPFAADCADLIEFLRAGDGQSQVQALSRILKPFGFQTLTLYRPLFSVWESWSEDPAPATKISPEEMNRIQETLKNCDLSIKNDELWTSLQTQPETLLYLRREEKEWKETELAFIRQLRQYTAAYSSSLDNRQNEIRFFHEIMDQMPTHLWIADAQTHEILFMNQAMKEDFQLTSPEGQPCWKVLQRGMNGPCRFCPLPALAAQSDLKLPHTQGERKNTLNQRISRNRDSRIHWIDGRLVHFQHAIDVTESHRLRLDADTDELTLIPNRRAGLRTLDELLEQVGQGQLSITAAMLDIDQLKAVNDQFGHREGDVLIRQISQTLTRLLRQEDLFFRLSGDEFILVLINQPVSAGTALLNQAQMQLRQWAEAEKKAYRCSFCFGLIFVAAGTQLACGTLLSQVDDAMYTQKRLLHIQLKESEKAQMQLKEYHGEVSFSYDSAYLYDALVESTDDYIFINNLRDDVFRYPQAMVEEFGLPGQIVRNAAAVWGEKVHPDDKAAFLEANQIILDGRATSHNVEYRALNQRGEWVWVRCRGKVVFDENGSPVLFAGMISNLSRKNKTDRITGLFNKIVYREETQRLITRRPDTPLAIMQLGLDDFKHINDLYDRSFGDEVLRISAQRIMSLLPENAEVYRLDGDEFGILISGCQPEAIRGIYKKLQTAFDQQMIYEGKRYYCTLSAGCAVYPQDAQSFLELVKAAGYALEQAKLNGKNRLEFFTRQILARKIRSLGIIEKMRESIDQNYAGFFLMYQPQVSVTTGQWIGFEALTRWQKEPYGFVPPNEFIPLLEESGMISPVGRWIFRQACAKCAQWSALAPALTMSINLSYLQLMEPDFIDYMQETLAATQVDPGRIIVEMTESVIASRAHALEHLFQRIHDLGMRIAMDDFGTGYSSLDMLKKMPADIVKIDRAFVHGVDASNFDESFIQFIVAICHKVNIEVCAEGVETEAEFQILYPMNVDTIQGYYFGKPMREEEINQKLKAMVSSGPDAVK